MYISNNSKIGSRLNVSHSTFNNSAKIPLITNKNDSKNIE